MLMKKVERNVFPLLFLSALMRLMSVALFFSIGIVLLAQSAFAQGGITVQELKQKIDAGEKFILIDVREPWEREEFNLGGQLIPLAQIVGGIAELENHKNDEIVVYCRTGSRSGLAQMKLVTVMGFTNVRSLTGGIIAWKDAYGATSPGYVNTTLGNPAKKPEASETPTAKTPSPKPGTPKELKLIKLYVGNLSSETTEETLRKAFEKYGEVKSVTIQKDENDNPIGYVEIAASAADAAIRH